MGELTVSRVLSWAIIYLVAKLLLQSSHPSKLCVEQTTLQSMLQWIGFTWQGMFPPPRWALTSPFHPYPQSGRYISVALSLRSPSAAVSRYPALWSSDFPHWSYKKIPAAAQPARYLFIVIQNEPHVKQMMKTKCKFGGSESVYFCARQTNGWR